LCSNKITLFLVAQVIVAVKIQVGTGAFHPKFARSGDAHFSFY